MKKQTYYKLCRKAGKEVYEQAAGEIITVQLPSGAVFTVAAEFSKTNRTYNLTDTATGLCAQNKPLKNRKQVDEFLQDFRTLGAFGHCVETDIYKRRKANMEKFKSTVI